MLQMNLDDDLGIAIAGGRDTPAIPNDSSIVITNVAKGSIADGKLRSVGILSVAINCSKVAIVRSRTFGD